MIRSLWSPLPLIALSVIGEYVGRIYMSYIGRCLSSMP
jgi:hypothetical protein